MLQCSRYRITQITAVHQGQMGRCSVDVIISAWDIITCKIQQWYQTQEKNTENQSCQYMGRQAMDVGLYGTTFFPNKTPAGIVQGPN